MGRRESSAKDFHRKPANVTVVRRLRTVRSSNSNGIGCSNPPAESDKKTAVYSNCLGARSQVCIVNVSAGQFFSYSLPVVPLAFAFVTEPFASMLVSLQRPIRHNGSRMSSKEQLITSKPAAQGSCFLGWDHSISIGAISVQVRVGASVHPHGIIIIVIEGGQAGAN